MARFLRIFQVEKIGISGTDEMTMPEYCKKHHFMRTLFNPSSWTVDPDNPEDIAFVPWSVVLGNLEATLEIIGKNVQFNVSVAEVVGGDKEKFPDVVALLNKTEWIIQTRSTSRYSMSLCLVGGEELTLWVDTKVRLLVEDPEHVVIGGKDELAAKLPSIVAKYSADLPCDERYTTQEEIDEAILAIWAGGQPVVVRGGGYTFSRTRPIWTLKPVPVCLYAENDGSLTVLRDHEMFVIGYFADMIERAEALGIESCQIVDKSGYCLDRQVEKKRREREEFRRRSGR